MEKYDKNYVEKMLEGLKDKIIENEDYPLLIVTEKHDHTSIGILSGLPPEKIVGLLEAALFSAKQKMKTLN